MLKSPAESSWVSVPRTLDASPRFLFWEIDYVMIFAAALAIGIIMSGAFTGCAAAAGACALWSKARAGGGVRELLRLSTGICLLMSSDACPQAQDATSLGEEP